LRTVQSKACRRCGGDLYWESDEYGAYLACIQCGGIARELAGLTSAHSSPRMLVASGSGRVKASTGPRHTNR